MTGQPVPEAQAATPADDRGWFHKVWDALRRGASRGSPVSQYFGGEGSLWNLSNPLVPLANGISGAVEGYNGTPPAGAPPAAAPVAPAPSAGSRLRLRDGRIVEQVGNQFFLIMPDGSRAKTPLSITP